MPSLDRDSPFSMDQQIDYNYVHMADYKTCNTLGECALTMAGGTKNSGKIYPVYLAKMSHQVWNY